MTGSTDFGEASGTTRSPRAARILVAGASGLIGSAAMRAARAAGHVVIGIDRRPAPDVHLADLAEPAPWRRAFDEHGGFDAVLCLSGFVGVARVLSDPEAARRGNTAPVDALLGALADAGDHELPRVVFASSSEVYLPSDAPLREGDPVRDVDERGRWAYAAAKVACEARLAVARAWRAGRGPVLVRFFNVVGPGQESAQGMVLPTFVERARGGLPLLVHGDGAQVRTLAHVDEVAPILVDLCAARSVPAGPLNVGGVARASVRAIAESVARAAGGARIEHVDPRRAVHPTFEDVRRRVPDLARLASLGFDPPRMDLDAIVRDVWTRHPAARPCASLAS